MKAVILAGGMGTRLAGETEFLPKPMVKIGDRPILWHIMKIYSHYGINDFIICAGYKAQVIKEYFLNYFLHTCDVNFIYSNSKVETTFFKSITEPWNVTVVDTGVETMTAGRLKEVSKFLNKGTFFVTYGDGLSDVNINDLLKFHQCSEALCTVTAVKMPGRFGTIEFNKKNQISSFEEKPGFEGSWINGGFFAMENSVLDYIESKQSILEIDIMPKLLKEGKLSAYKHEGFWECMDTPRDKEKLENYWRSGNVPWAFS